MKKGTSHFTLLKTVKWEVPFFMMLGLRTGVVFSTKRMQNAPNNSKK
jgi:hypothetical protein